MNEELNITLEWLKECAEYDWLFETSNSKSLYNYITNLEQKYEEADNDRHIMADKYENLQQDKNRLEIILHNITINGVEAHNISVLDLIKENQKLFKELQEKNALINLLNSISKENLYRYTPEKGFELVGDDE